MLENYVRKYGKKTTGIQETISQGFRTQKHIFTELGTLELDTLIPELKALERWISRSMLDLLFFLISRLNNACSPLVINLKIN